MRVDDNKRLDYGPFNWRGECGGCVIKAVPALNLSQDEMDQRLSELISIACIHQNDIDAEVRYWTSRAIDVDAFLDDRPAQLMAEKAAHMKKYRRTQIKRGQVYA